MSGVDSTDSQTVTEKVYVLVLHTGGTIGMKESPDGIILTFNRARKRGLVHCSFQIVAGFVDDRVLLANEIGLA